MKPARLWLITLIVVVLIVCLLSWPSRVNVTLPGVQVAGDGTVVSDVTVNIEGWQLKYLFLQDRMNISVTIQDPEKDTVPFIKMDGPVFDARVTEMWCTASCYNADIDGYEAVNLAFTDTMDTFILKRSSGDSIYVAASNIRENLPGILARFSFLFA